MATYRILHVDDDEEFAETTAAFLERRDGWCVRSVTDAESALELLDEEAVDCVVSDYRMPTTDGLELLDAVRDRSPDLPFVLFTSAAPQDVAGDALSADVSDYLRKRRGSDQFDLLCTRVENAILAARERRRGDDGHDATAHTDESATLFENLLDPAIRYRFEDGLPILERVNPAFESVFGFDAADVVGESLHDVLVPSDEQEAVRRLDGTIRSQSGPVERTVRRETSHGVKEFLLRNVPVGDGSDGRYYCIYTDLTEQRRHERRVTGLHEATRRLMQAQTRDEVAEIAAQASQNTLDYENSVVRLVDEAGERLLPVAVTRGARSILGERPVYPVGTGTAGRAFERGEVFVYDDLDTVDDGFERGNAQSGLYIPIGRHGTLSINDPRPAAFDESDIRLAQILAANAETAFDRVARIRTLERQNERLEEFASVVSHDLRNPLSVIEGRVALVRDELDDHACTTHLTPIERAVNRMDELVEDVLTLARTGDAIGTVTDVDLAALAAAAWTATDTADATLSVAPDVGAVVADGTRLRQLLTNLFVNAVAHGGDDVTVRVGTLADGFFVADDGPGIPSDERERVFEQGYTRSHDGTGIGLTIVRRIAEAHGWSVAVAESSEGGARFEVRGVETATRASAE